MLLPDAFRAAFPFHKGFTLVELLVTLAIFAFLVAAGVPALNTLQENMSIKSASDRLMNSLAYARSEAVSRTVNVSICSGVSTCKANDWASGWTVFIDNNGDGSQSTGDEVLRVDDIASSGVSVTRGPAHITFNKVGENTAATEYKFRICGTRKKTDSSRFITVSTVGYGMIDKGTSC